MDPNQPNAPEATPTPTPVAQPAAPTVVPPVVPTVPAAQTPPSPQQAVPTPVQPPGPATTAAPASVPAPGVTVPNNVASKKTFKILHRHEPIARFAVIAITVIAIGFNLFWIFHVRAIRTKNYNDQPAVQAAKAQKNFGPEVVDRSDGTLDMSKQVDASLTVKDQTLSAHLNQQVNLANGLSFMVTGVHKDWKSLNTFNKPSAGNYFVELNVIIGNRSTVGQSYYLGDITGNLDGKLLTGIVRYPFKDELPANDTDLSDTVGQPDLSPGQTRSGVVIIEVPDNTLPALTLTKKDFSKTFKNVVMKVTINLQ